MQKLLRFMSQEQTQGKYVATGLEKETPFASKIHKEMREMGGRPQEAPLRPLPGPMPASSFQMSFPVAGSVLLPRVPENQSTLQRLTDVTLGKIILTISPKFPSLSSPHFE